VLAIVSHVADDSALLIVMAAKAIPLFGGEAKPMPIVDACVHGAGARFEAAVRHSRGMGLMLAKRVTTLCLMGRSLAALPEQRMEWGGDGAQGARRCAG
jgi:hypothetical protein